MKLKKISIMLVGLLLTGTVLTTGCSRKEGKTATSQISAETRPGIIVDADEETEAVKETVKETEGAKSDEPVSGGASIVFSSLDEEETEEEVAVLSGIEELPEEETGIAEVPELVTVLEAENEGPKEVTASSTITFDEVGPEEGPDLVEEPLQLEDPELLEETEEAVEETEIPVMAASVESGASIEFEEPDEDPQEQEETEEEAESEQEQMPGSPMPGSTQVELQDVTVNLPQSWAGHYTTVNFGDATIFYQKECRDAGDGGHLFTIEKFTDNSYENLNNYEILATKKSVTYVLEQPVDNQSGTDTTNHDLYMNMELDIPTIIRDLTFAPGYQTMYETELADAPEMEVTTSEELEIPEVSTTVPVTAGGPTEEKDSVTDDSSVLPLGANSTLAEYSSQIEQELNAIGGDNSTTTASGTVAAEDTTTAAAATIALDSTDNTAGNGGTAEVKTDAATGYILPESSTRLYVASELSGMSDWELTLARNEIYARHGRKFNSPDLQSYFNGCSWYEGTTEPSEFDAIEASTLTSIEKANIEMIYELQGKPSLGVVSAPSTAAETTTPATGTAAPVTSTPATTPQTAYFVLDNQNYVFHMDSCSLVSSISPQYYGESTEDASALQLKGYIGCSLCIQ